jgi:hypothetical protein
MASLAERYSNGLIGLSAFVQPFNYMCGKNRYSYLPSEQVKFCIDMWRIVSLILYINPLFFNNDILSLTGHCIVNNVYVYDEFITISDASPYGICGAIIDKYSKSFICYTFIPILFKDPDGKFQGLREYLGVLTVLLLVKIYFKNSNTRSIKWISDNTGALSWAKKNRCTSSHGHAANIITAWFQIYSSYHIHQVAHIPGVNMGFIDDISRKVENPLTLVVPFVDVFNESVSDLFSLCDPTFQHSLVNNMESFFNVHVLMKSILKYFKINTSF